MRRLLAAVLALLAVGWCAPASAQAPGSTPFFMPARTPIVAMFSKARTQVDCLPKGCPAVPVIYDPAEVPADSYSTAFQGALASFLVDVRLRDRTEFTQRDSGMFNLSLNVLDRYWSCLEGRFGAAGEADYADVDAVDRLAARASDECRAQRDAAMRRIAYDGPDFVAFDWALHAQQPNARISELLQFVQRFAIAYHAGLHGVRWSDRVAGVALPEPVAQSDAASDR